MKCVPAPIVALAAAAALLLAGCENPFAAKITAIKVLAASPAVGLSAEGGSAIANGGSFGFGELSVSATKDQSFVITNSGKSPLSILAGQVAISGTDAASFSLASSLPESVKPQGNAKFTIRFAPSALGAKSARLSFATNDVSNASFAIALSGTGTNQAPAPVIAGGLLQCFPDGLTTVSISCSDSSAVIYYTTDGSVPSLSMLGTSTIKYSSPFVFSFAAAGSGSVRAMAKVEGMSDSNVVTAFFTASQVLEPSASPGAETFLSGDTLPAFTLSSATSNAAGIAFTISGADPSPGDASLVTITNGESISDTGKTYVAVNGYTFNYAGPHTGGSLALKATAFVPKGSTYLCSDITTISYAFKMATPAWASAQPSTAYHDSALSVTLSCAGAAPTSVVYYTTDGTTPSASSTRYSGSIAVLPGAAGSSTAMVINAIAIQSDWQNSEALTGCFYVCGPGLWDSSKWEQATWQ